MQTCLSCATKIMANTIPANFFSKIPSFQYPMTPGIYPALPPFFQKTIRVLLLWSNTLTYKYDNVIFLKPILWKQNGLTIACHMKNL